MRILGADSFTGKETSIDAIPKSYLRHGDVCMVKDELSENLFWYRYNINSGVASNIPNVIIPKDNMPPNIDDNGRWLLCNIFMNVVYANDIKTNTISPGTSGSDININGALTISPSGTHFVDPLIVDTDIIGTVKEPPFIINSDEKVVNLNADKLDGYDSNDFVVKEYGITSLPYDIPSGSVPPSAGERWIYISFNKRPLNVDYSVFTTITNTVDPSASIYATTITEKTTAGFKCEFSGRIDSHNYKLEYMAIGDFK